MPADWTTTGIEEDTVPSALVIVSTSFTMEIVPVLRSSFGVSVKYTVLVSPAILKPVDFIFFPEGFA